MDGWMQLKRDGTPWHRGFRWIHVIPLDFSRVATFCAVQNLFLVICIIFAFYKYLVKPYLVPR